MYSGRVPEFIIDFRLQLNRNHEGTRDSSRVYPHILLLSRNMYIAASDERIFQLALSRAAANRIQQTGKTWRGNRPRRLMIVTHMGFKCRIRRRNNITFDCRSHIHIRIAARHTISVLLNTSNEAISRETDRRDR